MPVGKSKKARFKHIVKLLNALEKDTEQGGKNEQIIYDVITATKGRFEKALDKLE